MKTSSSLAVLTCVAAIAGAVYLAYDATGAGSTGAPTSERITSLGELIAPQESVILREMDPAELDTFYGSVIGHPAFAEAEEFFQQKGLPPWDPASHEAVVATVDGTTVQIWSQETHPANGTYGVFVFAKDEEGSHQIWRMVTNIGQKSIEGGDPTISDIPVYVWSNGMPVYYVSIWHWIGGYWYPYHYWWHNSHNHPNWYYSYYNHWWWRHYWYGYAWAPWYDWCYAWFYWRYFNYWSTYFPY